MTQETSQINRRARKAQLLIAIVTVLVLSITAVVVAIARPSATLADAPVWQELPRGTEEVTPWVHEDPRFYRERDLRHPGLVLINEAMAAGDREAFLSFAEGEAVEQMALWWDNTKKIGWDYAYMVPRFGWDDSKEQNLMRMGASLAFAASPARGSGNPDAGLQLTQGFEFFVTSEGYGEDLKITSLTEIETALWLEDPIHVVKNEHSVVYGSESEAEYIESLAPQVEEAAIDALDQGERLSGERNVEGFVVAVTDDHERYDLWTFGVPIDSAGVAISTTRPPYSGYIPSGIAAGAGASGVFIAIAPHDSDEERYTTLIHEFGHAIHNMSETRGENAEASEGFASYFEAYTGAGDSRITRAVQQRVAAEGYAAFSEEALRDGGDMTRVNEAYAAAQSVYLFVEAQGGDPWELAMEAFQPEHGHIEAQGLSKAFENLGSEYTEEAWQAWVAAQETTH